MGKYEKGQNDTQQNVKHNTGNKRLRSTCVTRLFLNKQNGF